MHGKTPPSGLEMFGGAVAVAFAIVLTAAVRGLVLTILWGWFIEPLGVAGINVAEAVGIAAITGLLWQQLPKEGERNVPFATAFWAGMIGAAVTLTMGFIAHLFI